MVKSPRTQPNSSWSHRGFVPTASASIHTRRVSGAARPRVQSSELDPPDHENSGESCDSEHPCLISCLPPSELLSVTRSGCVLGSRESGAQAGGEASFVSRPVGHVAQGEAARAEQDSFRPPPPASAALMVPLHHQTASRTGITRFAQVHDDLGWLTHQHVHIRLRLLQSAGSPMMKTSLTAHLVLSSERRHLDPPHHPYRGPEEEELWR
ncbi:uncharacterized protein LOC121641492 [Melanotaenia boesemani]|uniref:uncharacterized protein LOC121641492 n=1 Tax=Melanotaenia boesemani TaxID=1250792 RepID=UPI001C059F5A|nr:uncharacterized protein LOC121641492 [Melanotaenia boesemani]